MIVNYITVRVAEDSHRLPGECGGSFVGEAPNPAGCRPEQPAVADLAFS